MLNIYIPKPCHEDWNAMTPTEKGAFCAVCTKEVMDFSNMSDDEVRNYLLQHAGKKTCGRFRKSQLKGLNIVVDEQLIYTNIAMWKKFLAAVVICFGMFFSSCDNITNGKVETVESMSTNPVATKPDTIAVELVKDSLNKKFSKTVCTTIKGALPIVEPAYVVGDIAPPPIEPVRPEVAEAPPEPIPLPDTAKKIVDTCRNPQFL